MTQAPIPPAATPANLSHPEFVTAFQRGTLTVHFDPKGAARYLSGMLWLPLFALPVLGTGVALALTGWVWTGLAIIAAGIIAPRLIKRGAPHFLLQQALTDENLYRNLLAAQIMQVSLRGPA